MKGAPGAYNVTDFSGLMMFYFFLPVGCTFYLLFAQACLKHEAWSIASRIKIGVALSLLSLVAGAFIMLQWGQFFTLVTTPFISYAGQVPRFPILAHPPKAAVVLSRAVTTPFYH